MEKVYQNARGDQYKATGFEGVEANLLSAWGSDGEFTEDTFMSQLKDLMDAGVLEDYTDRYVGLAEAIAEYMHASGLKEGDDGFENAAETKAAALEHIHEILLGGADAWAAYAEAAQKALLTDPTEEQQRQAAALLATSKNVDELRKNFNSLTPAQQNWASKNIKGVKDMLEGTRDYEDAIKDVRKESAKLDADHMADLGKVWKDTSKIMEAASKGGSEFNKVYSSSVKDVQKLQQAWGAYNALQSGTLTETKDITDAYNTLASATGLNADSLRDNMSPALEALQMETLSAQGTIEYLANWLNTLSGVNITNENWSSELARLSGDADSTTSHVASLIQTLLQASESRLYLGNDNTVHVQWGKGNYTPPSVSSPSSHGGGGGSSHDNDSKKNTSKNEITKIQKMVDMMKQIQDLFKFHQSMIQQIQSIYSTKGEFTNLIQVYDEEYKAIEKNNKVLENNLKKLEKLIPSQQKLVASMSTSDERYKQASEDLKRLQDAHQEYSKQLLENAEALEELKQKIEDAYEEIRQKRITVENMILEAIEDREALEKRMLEGRVEMEETIMDVLVKRYEKERDLIIENAELQKDALQQEADLLDENLQKRKERNEQDKKRQQLLEYEQQLARISADPTRRTEQDKLRTKIAELREELAWDTAEQEVNAQKDSIEQQINSLDEYIEYVERYYEDLFAHPKKLIEEVRAILSQTDEEIIAWLKQNDEEYQSSSAATQQTMIQNWEQTLMDMRGEIQTHWDEVAQIMAQGDDYIINFLIQNSAKYREASATQAQSYVAEWKKNLKELEAAYKSTYERIKQYSYVPIRMDTYSGSSGSTGNSSKTGKKNGNNNNNSYGVYVNDNYLYGSYGSEQEANNAVKDLRRDGIYQDIDKLTVKKKYAAGGLASKTGLAWLDGTPNAPERVLSPYQTELFEDLLASLHSIKASVNLPSVAAPQMTENTSQGFVMEGDIILNVETLADDEDYEEVATRVMEEIASRMNFGNIVGGMRFGR